MMEIFLPRELTSALRRLLILLGVLALPFFLASCSHLPCPAEGYAPLSLEQYQSLCKGNAYKLGACSLRTHPPRCRARAPSGLTIKPVDYVVYQGGRDYRPEFRETRLALFPDKPFTTTLDLSDGAGQTTLARVPDRLVAIIPSVWGGGSSIANVDLNQLIEEHDGRISFFGHHLAVKYIEFEDKEICLIIGTFEHPARRLICEAAFSGVRCGTNCLNEENDSDMAIALEKHQ